MKLTALDIRIWLVALFAQIDKQAHALGGALLMLIGYDVFYTPLRALTLDRLAAHVLACVLALACTLVLCYLKETVYDARRPAEHTRDMDDAWAGAIGAAVLFIWKAIVWPVYGWLLL
jgi:hypothetical protein